MCGRFALKAPPRTIQEHFHLPEPLDLAPRYNIAPSQKIGVVRHLPGKNAGQLDMLRWGLIPHWAKDMKIGYRMINARAETIAQKPSFRIAFQKRRCLIPADGFYEWHRAGKTKQPFFIHLKNDEVFSFAGLWESWRGPDDKTVESCTIITTAANELVGEMHDRMPVIIPRENYDAWLNNATPRESLQQFLVPYPDEEMKAYRVSSKVNNPKNDDAECIRSIEAS